MMSPLESSEFLDLYEPVATLGRGGMGHVVRIRHRVWGHDLAAKVPLRSVVRDAGGLERFRREAELWVDLPLHPHVVTCHYVRIFSGVPVIFAEHMAGGSVADRIRSEAFTGDEIAALGLAFDVACGLEHAHERGLIHQDIKPSNVLIQDGEAKITDFGIAKLASDPSTQEVPADGLPGLRTTTVAMTPLYASPEQLAAVSFGLHERGAITPATDVWSLGLTLLELLLGPSPEGAFWWSPGAVPEHLFERLAPDVRVLVRSLLVPEASRRPSIERTIDELAVLLASRDVHRTRPSSAALRADGLNNRGISAIDLGRLDEAEAQFTQALSIDPCHPEAVFNHTLLLWRAGSITDVAALERVRQTVSSSSSWEAGLLHAWIEIERGNEAGTWKAIDSVAEQGAGLPRATRSVARASRAVRDAIREVWSFRAHSDIADALHVSSDERWLITGGRDGRVRLFELESGELVREFGHHEGYVFGVALSRDGERLFSTSWDEKLRVFDVKTGSLLASAEHPGKLIRVLVAPGRDDAADHLLTTSHSGLLRQWSFEKGHQLEVVRDWLALPNDEDVNCAALSHDAKLCVVGAGTSLYVFDWPAGTLLRTHELPSRPHSAAFVPQQPNQACLGLSDQRVLVFDVTQGKTLAELTGLHSWVNHMDVDPIGRWMVCSDGLAWTLWDLPERRCLRTFSAPKLLTGARFLRDGSLLTLDWGGMVRRYQIDEPARAPWMAAVPRLGRELSRERERLRQTLQAGEEAWAAGRRELALQALEQARATAGFARDPSVLALAERLSTQLRRRHVRAIWPLASIASVQASRGVLLDAARQRLITVATDGSVQVRELPTGTCRETLRFSPEDLLSRAMAAEPTTGALAVGTYRRVVVFAVDGAIRWQVDVGTGYVRAVRFSPSGGKLAVARDDGRITWFDARDGSALGEVHANETWLECVEFWGEERLVSGDYHGRLLLWDLASASKGSIPVQVTQPEPRQAVLGQLDTEEASGLADGVISQMSHEGTSLFFASGNGSVRVLDPSTQQELAAFSGHASPVSSFDFMGDDHLVSVGFDKRLLIFERSSRSCIAQYEGHTHPLWSVIVEDAHHVWTISDDQILRRLYVDWDLVAMT